MLWHHFFTDINTVHCGRSTAVINERGQLKITLILLSLSNVAVLLMGSGIFLCVHMSCMMNSCVVDFISLLDFN